MLKPSLPPLLLAVALAFAAGHAGAAGQAEPSLVDFSPGSYAVANGVRQLPARAVFVKLALRF
jgi:hypothetical protein